MKRPPIAVDTDIRNAEFPIEPSDPRRPLVKISAVVDCLVEDTPEKNVAAAKIDFIDLSTDVSQLFGKQLEKPLCGP